LSFTVKIVFEEVSQLGVTIRDHFVGLVRLILAEDFKARPKSHKRIVDVSCLENLFAAILGAAGSLASGQVHQRQLTNDNASFVCLHVLAIAVQWGLNEANREHGVAATRLGVQHRIRHSLLSLASVESFKSLFWGLHLNFNNTMNKHVVHSIFPNYLGLQGPDKNQYILVE